MNMLNTSLPIHVPLNDMANSISNSVTSFRSIYIISPHFRVNSILVKLHETFYWMFPKTQLKLYTTNCWTILLNVS